MCEIRSPANREDDSLYEWVDTNLPTLLSTVASSLSSLDIRPDAPEGLDTSPDAPVRLDIRPDAPGMIYPRSISKSPAICRNELLSQATYDKWIVGPLSIRARAG